MALFLSYYRVFNCEFLVTGDSLILLLLDWERTIAFNGVCSVNAISLFQIVPEERCSPDWQQCCVIVAQIVPIACPGLGLSQV